MLPPTRLAELSAALAAPGAAGVDGERARAGRRSQGAYFTPAPLVDVVVRETLAPLLARARWDDDGAPRLRVLDPAAGDGRFLVAAVEALVAAATARRYPAAAARKAIVARCVIGLERDAAFAALARQRLGARAIHVCEALLGAPEAAYGVDAVVGNPPYLRSIRFAESDAALWAALRGRYAATSHGEWDLYAAFVEQSLDWVRPGGEIGLVVPSRWLTAAFAAPLRAKLAAAGAVRGVVDFGDAQVFPEATTYASLIFLTRPAAPPASKPAAAPEAPAVAVARLRDARWSVGAVPASELGAAPWRLAVGASRSLIEQLSAGRPTLGQVARIAKGAGTNADGVYVVEHAELRGRRVLGVCAADREHVVLEAALVPACLRGRDITAYGDVAGDVRCLLPYDEAGALIPADVLARRYPLAAAHLARHRRRLEARERGRFRGPGYHCFGRPQNLVFHRDPAPKIVVPDVVRQARALIDTGGALVLDSAYAVRPLERSRAAGDLYDPWLLLAVLASPVVELWIGETGVPLRGGYLRLKTAYLQSLPIPSASPETAAAARAAAAGDRAAACDALRRAYDLAPDAWSQIVRRDSVSG